MFDNRDRDHGNRNFESCLRNFLTKNRRRKSVRLSSRVPIVVSFAGPAVGTEKIMNDLLYKITTYLNQSDKLEIQLINQQIKSVKGKFECAELK